MEGSAFFRKITYKRIALVLAGLFLLSLLPILYCSFFDYATGDDLWEGAAAYRVLVNNGSPGELVRAVYDWARVDYLGWEGNWSSIVLWCLQPGIWGEKAYCITPWLSVFSLCVGTAYFLAYYLKKYLAAGRSFWLIVSAVVCFFSVQYMPYIRGGIFWYTGMINYVVPYGLCLAAFVWMDQFAELGKKRCLVCSSLFFAYLGGAGYTTIVLAFEVMLLLLVFYLFGRDRVKRARAFWLLLPPALLTAGFLFSALSPGNAVRGGDSYSFDMERVFFTIFESIKQGGQGVLHWFTSVRPLFLSIPILVLAAWEQIDLSKARLKFKHPVLVVSVLFLISCSVYAPGIYAQSEVSGGVPDSIYFVFLLTCALAVLYLTGCVKRLAVDKNWKMPGEELLARLRFGVILGELLFCMVFGRYLIGNMADYVCIEFIRSGKLRDFEDQMQERLAILHDPEITHVILPEMNDEQGPFMHMALTGDPEAYTNMATARFYGKESVIAVPRAQYYEQYGYPEEK